MSRGAWARAQKSVEKRKTELAGKENHRRRPRALASECVMDWTQQRGWAEDGASIECVGNRWLLPFDWMVDKEEGFGVLQRRCECRAVRSRNALSTPPHTHTQQRQPLSNGRKPWIRNAPSPTRIPTLTLPTTPTDRNRPTAPKAWRPRRLRRRRPRFETDGCVCVCSGGALCARACMSKPEPVAWAPRIDQSIISPLSSPVSNPHTPKTKHQSTQLMSDMRAILRNLRQWPTAAEPQGDFQGYVREQVRHDWDGELRGGMRVLVRSMNVLIHLLLHR